MCKQIYEKLDLNPNQPRQKLNVSRIRLSTGVRIIIFKSGLNSFGKWTNAECLSSTDSVLMGTNQVCLQKL